jgi:hypothetical protein
MDARADDVPDQATESVGTDATDDTHSVKHHDARLGVKLDATVDATAERLEAGLGATQTAVDGVFHRLTHWLRRS